MRLAALPGIGNGHTGIFPGDPEHRRDLHFYPLRLYAFGDGTYVVDEKGKDGLVGARLTAIGGVPYAEVAKRVRPLVPHDNASNLQGLLPHYVLTAEVLDGLGIADGLSPLEFTFTQGGRSRTVTLAPVSVPSYVTTFRDPIHGHYPSLLPRRKPTPLYLRKSASPLWVGTLDRGRAVFVGFNSVQRPSFTLVDRVSTLSHRPQVKRVIVDLRLNGGGNNTTYASLLSALTDSSVNRKGRLFVLIGRATFSAAANFAADVDRLHEGDVHRRADRRLRARLWRHRFSAAPEERDQRAHRSPLLGLRQGLRRPPARDQPGPQGQGHDRGLPRRAGSGARGGAHGLTSANCGRFVRGTPCARPSGSHSVVLAPSTERE